MALSMQQLQTLPSNLPGQSPCKAKMPRQQGHHNKKILADMLSSNLEANKRTAMLTFFSRQLGQFSFCSCFFSSCHGTQAQGLGFSDTPHGAEYDTVGKRLHCTVHRIHFGCFSAAISHEIPDPVLHLIYFLFYAQISTCSQLLVTTSPCRW